MLKLHIVLLNLESTTNVQENTIKRLKLNYMGCILISFQLLRITQWRVGHGRNKGWHPQMLKLHTVIQFGKYGCTRKNH